MYTWDKYTKSTKTIYTSIDLKLSGNPPWGDNAIGSTILAGNSYIFDESTGKYTLPENASPYYPPSKNAPVFSWLLSDTYSTTNNNIVFAIKDINEPSNYALYIATGYGGYKGVFSGVTATSSTETIRGSKITTVSSTSSSSYPSDGILGSYWYVSTGSHVEYLKGSFVESVISRNSTTYPINGRHSDGYWYVKQ